MTSSTPSILPAPSGSGSSDLSAASAPSPRRDDPGLRFDDFCPDGAADHGRKQSTETRSAPTADQRPDGGDPTKEPKSIVATEPDAPGSTETVEPSAEGPEAIEAVDAPQPVAEASNLPLEIVVRPEDLENPQRLLAAIAAALTQLPAEAAHGQPREILLVLQRPEGVQPSAQQPAQPLAKSLFTLPTVDLPAAHPSRVETIAATLATLVQAALAFGKKMAPTPAPTPATTPAPTPATTPAPTPAPPPEKSAVRTPVVADGPGAENQEKFLPTNYQSLGKGLPRAGTDGALREDVMKSTPDQAQNRVVVSHADRRGRAMPEITAGTTGSDFSTWKGWTNGGGERVSSAAQFSRLSERIADAVGQQASTTTGSGASVASTASSRAPVPVALPFPVSDAALLGPLGNAVERMVLRGQDQLSLTIRFEQGGSLALRLSLKDGEVRTHIRTDLSGLENALRSAWTMFSQDWSGRGVKLAAPTFSSSTDTNPEQHQSTAQQDQRSESTGDDNVFRLPARSRSERAARPARHHPDAGVVAEPARSTDRGLHVWA